MGQVWAAMHTESLRLVALKLLRAPAQPRSELGRRALREARALNLLNHPNVVRVHEVFETADGAPAIAMELLEGETLGQRLTRDGALSLGEAANIFVPLVSAVGSAHAVGIVHRDIKPDNVFLVGATSPREDVRVLDFGLAKFLATEADGAGGVSVLTDTGAVLGTPCYMSPEQGFGDNDIDHRSDVWSLGAMLYEALSGARPVDGWSVGQVMKRLTTTGITPISVLVPNLPSDITTLVDRMLLRNRRARPQNLQEVHETLTRYTSVRAPSFGAPVHEG